MQRDLPQLGLQIPALQMRRFTHKGFWNAIEFIKPQKTFVVVPISGSYPIKENVLVCGLNEVIEYKF